MNERISEIWDQAAKASALLRLGENSWETQKAFIEKFALLIVKECADIVADAVDHREPASTYVEKIKQHFGVEE